MPKLPSSNFIKNMASMSAFAAAKPMGKARSAASSVMRMLPHHEKLQQGLHGFIPGASRQGMAQLGERLARSAEDGNRYSAPTAKGVDAKGLVFDNLAGRFGEFTEHLNARFKQIDRVVDDLNKLRGTYDPKKPSDLANTATDSVIKMLLEVYQEHSYPGQVNASNLLDGSAAPGSAQAERDRRRMLKGSGGVDGGDDDLADFGAEDTDNDGHIDPEEELEHTAEADDNVSVASGESHSHVHQPAYTPTPVASSDADSSLVRPEDSASNVGTPEVGPSAARGQAAGGTSARGGAVNSAALDDEMAGLKAARAARQNSASSETGSALTAANLDKLPKQPGGAASVASFVASQATPSQSSRAASELMSVSSVKESLTSSNRIVDLNQDEPLLPRSDLGGAK